MLESKSRIFVILRSQDHALGLEVSPAMTFLRDSSEPLTRRPGTERGSGAGGRRGRTAACSPALSPSRKLKKTPTQDAINTGRPNSSRNTRPFLPSPLHLRTSLRKSQPSLAITHRCRPLEPGRAGSQCQKLYKPAPVSSKACKKG